MRQVRGEIIEIFAKLNLSQLVGFLILGYYIISLSLSYYANPCFYEEEKIYFDFEKNRQSLVFCVAGDTVWVFGDGVAGEMM